MSCSRSLGSHARTFGSCAPCRASSRTAGVPKARELKRAVDAAVVALGGEQAQHVVAGPRQRTTPAHAPAARAGVGAAPPLDRYARHVALAPAVVIVHKILPETPSWTRSAWSIWLTHLAPGALATLGIILLFK